MLNNAYTFIIATEIVLNAEAQRVNLGTGDKVY